MEALIFVSIALSQTPADLKSTDYCIAWSACLAPSLRRYQFILLGELRHMCVWTTCPGSLSEAETRTY